LWRIHPKTDMRPSFIRRFCKCLYNTWELNTDMGIAESEKSLILLLQMMLRIWFGLILKITVWTKSYKPPKQHYFVKTLESQAKLSLFSGFLPNYSPIIQAIFAPAWGMNIS
jgi:hypothetical protein